MSSISNSNPIDLAAEKNRQRTTTKVIEALERLKKSGGISIQKVAKEAGISRKTLYNRPDLKAMIEEVKSLMKDTKNNKEKRGNVHSLQEERIIKLRDKVKTLQQEKQKLLEQNAGLTETVFELKQEVLELQECLYQEKRITSVERE
ncbi:TetR/AcrR family transcriptional regulator [Bacillus cereus group sp. BfR-BA-01119]|uniref:TetR/AcrR family transcriptional regulator n=1 Tax=unclassified Bacillus cereus group TaxID=2750818 RepID=UPI000772541F|nr:MULTISPECIES: TetR/AcrR family transcriptional regulator [unclassified Bacillus cereus group]MDX5868846.1 TetR/AcrR family transcriptional regulator [Bacillus cereus group sp. BfR-BA-01119]MDX5960096.1 TetR/AcrR family transcriptional regulator [Bacillus cereus group sp. BfR-BA-00331]